MMLVYKFYKPCVTWFFVTIILEINSESMNSSTFSSDNLKKFVSSITTNLPVTYTDLQNTTDNFSLRTTKIVPTTVIFQNTSGNGSFTTEISTTPDNIIADTPTEILENSSNYTMGLGDSCKCGLANFGTGKIVGGSEVDENHLWPWFASVIRADRPTAPVHCGGSLISAQYVATAAHCLVPMIQFGLRNFQIRLGYNDIRQNDTLHKFIVPIESVTLHPKFDANSPYYYDIGVVKLAYAVNCSNWMRVRPICLPSEEDGSFAGDIATTAGFGRDSVNGIQSPVLQQIKINVISNDECQTHYKKLPFQGPVILDSMLCAWGKGRDSCTGDSGGPLFLKRKSSSSYIQIGITSWGIGCANERFPGVYTKLERYVPWVKSIALDL